jgi:hypothetical protein
MTFVELAATRAITRASAIRMVRRKRWRRMQDNQGRTLVLVPDEWLVRPDDSPEGSPGDGLADAPGSAPFPAAKALAALETAVQTLTDQLAKADARVTDTEGRLAQTEVRLAETEAERDRAQEAARIAIGAANTLRQADDARKARGRLRRAWDGWRGR